MISTPRRDTVIASEHGFLLCPKCGKRTKTKVIPGTTQIHRFPLYCGWCHEEYIIDYK